MSSKQSSRRNGWTCCSPVAPLSEGINWSIFASRKVLMPLTLKVRFCYQSTTTARKRTVQLAGKPIRKQHVQRGSTTTDRASPNQPRYCASPLGEPNQKQICRTSRVRSRQHSSPENLRFDARVALRTRTTRSEQFSSRPKLSAIPCHPHMLRMERLLVI